MGNARSIASITGTAIGGGSKLLFKVWRSLRKGRSEVKKGAKVFYKTLRENGIPQEEATQIAIAFAKPAWEILSIRGIMRLIRDLDEDGEIPMMPFGI
ncbi:MAG: hypothetical protein ThorAB25_02180 [Candidatus Thorarchaeota archaeon AB_25]|nr:MAG: hypothetical protein ThorAB25_02180 [Candidatus Thorarchaeota archaeon AB_25]